MSDRSIEVLEIFAEEGAHDRVLTSHDAGVWRQWRTPDVQRAARSVEIAARARQNLLDRHGTDEAVRAASARLKRESRDRRRVAGTCIECGESRDPESSNYCTAHREAHRARAEKRRRAMSAREKFPIKSRHGHKVREGDTIHFVIHSPVEADVLAGLETPRMEEVDGYLTVNVFPDGRPGEIFIRCGKEGYSKAWMDQWCEMFSMLLQYGEHVESLCQRFTNTSYLPYGGVTGVPGVARCTSPADLICKILLQKFGGKVDAEAEVRP